MRVRLDVDVEEIFVKDGFADANRDLVMREIDEVIVRTGTCWRGSP